MKPDRIKEITGKVLTKELHDELLGFNGNTILRCVEKHSVTFDSGLTVNTQRSEVGERDRLKYVYFNLDTYGCWIIEEVKNNN